MAHRADYLKREIINRITRAVCGESRMHGSWRGKWGQPHGPTWITIEAMEEQNHIDKALAFLESLEKLGNQLKVAEENQKQFLARMLELKKSGETDSEEYADLSRKSKGLQDIIDKWRPIYLERMEMVKSVQMKKRKRSGKK